MPHVKYRSPSIAPAYTGRLSTDPIPALRLPDESMEPSAAYRFIHDELMLDGSSRLNLATFVTTWMDPEAERLMAETFDKNMIDKDEYPRRPLSNHVAWQWLPICSTPRTCAMTIRRPRSACPRSGRPKPSCWVALR